jgi:hypothetical protein
MSRGAMIMMKAVLSALVALSMLAGASLSASAADEYDFPSNVFDNIQRHLP